MVTETVTEYRLTEGGLLAEARCAICGGIILAATSTNEREQAMNKRVAVMRHREEQRHQLAARTYETCGCPVERATDLPCLVTTPNGRVCHGCRNH